MTDDFTIRNFRAEDIDAVVRLFRDTIHTVNAKDYTKAQLDAWAPGTIDNARWCQNLLNHFTVVTEKDGVLCGFGDIHENGYFDHLFVHKDFQGQGVASKIVAAIEEHAVQKDIKSIEVHVSITAYSFFISKGYLVVAPQKVTYNGQEFTNYVMRKSL
ncbi:GNAT family N-acetyltransferase [Flavobacterium sp. RHBU_24]|uniref:GNAT family N-acetyltransferase n=1 Tax=Flavobacterium sp. RHBU_24 TaxID=3391185 RepID=UPI0039856A0F